MRPLFAVLLLLALPTAAEPLTYSLSAGAGHSHALLGLRLEAAGDHFGGFVAAGGANLIGDPSFAAGLRWTSGIRQGLMLSLHLDGLHETTSATPETLFVLALTVGYRLRIQRFWIEAAVGPTLYLDSYYLDNASDGAPRNFKRQFGFGAAGGADNPQIPDLELAIGFEL